MRINQWGCSDSGLTRRSPKPKTRVRISAPLPNRRIINEALVESFYELFKISNWMEKSRPEMMQIVMIAGKGQLNPAVADAFLTATLRQRGLHL